MPYTQQYDEQALVVSRESKVLTLSCRSPMPYEYALVEKYVRKAEEGGLLPEEAAFVDSRISFV